MLSISRVLPILAATRIRIGPSFGRGDRRQRLGVPDFEIIQREACAGDHFGAAGHRGLDIVAGPQPPRAFLHGAVQHRRGAPLFRRQIDVARRHREAVALAHGARAHHLDAEVEIRRHPRHHPQLLEILFAEDREIRPHLREQLADHGGDAAEEVRTEAVLQTGGGRAFGQDPGGKAVRVHGLDVGIPDQVDILGGELGDIGLPGARVGTEILRWRELGGVDEDRNHDLGGAPFRQPDQRHMAVMECSHGWHQRESWPFSREGYRARGATRGPCGRSWGFAASGLDLSGCRAASRP